MTRQEFLALVRLWMQAHDDGIRQDLDLFSDDQDLEDWLAEIMMLHEMMVETDGKEKS